METTINFNSSQSTDLSQIVLSNENVQHPYMLLKTRSNAIANEIVRTLRGALRVAIMTEEKEQQPKFNLAEVDVANSFIKLEGNLYQAVNFIKEHSILNNTITTLLLSPDDDASTIINSTKDFILKGGTSIIDIAKPLISTQLNVSNSQHVEAVISDLKNSSTEQQKIYLDALTKGLLSLGIKVNLEPPSPSTNNSPVLSH